MKNNWLKIFIPKVEILVPSFSYVNALRKSGVIIYRAKAHQDGVAIIVSKNQHQLIALFPLIRYHSIYSPLQKFLLPLVTVILFVLVLTEHVTINYEIKGNLTSDEIEELDGLLNAHFYNVMNFEFLKTSEDEVLQTIHDQYNEFVWTNIYQHGTSLVIDVYDIEGIEEQEITAKTDTLYARRSGVVMNYVVDNCRVLVSQNQFVREGDPLVSCFVEHPLTLEPIEIDASAMGEVFANTWYEVTLTAMKQYEDEVFTTNAKTFYSINIGNFELTLPVQEVPFEVFDVRSKVFDLFFFMTESPLYVERQNYYEKSVIMKENTYEDIFANLETLIEQAFVQTYDDDEFRIEEITILSEEETEDAWIFRCHLTVYENIAQSKELDYE